VTHYIGTVITEVEVEADHPGDAFEQLEGIAESMSEALRNDGIEYLHQHVGGSVHEYED
jgi:hypothetical protein